MNQQTLQELHDIKLQERHQRRTTKYRLRCSCKWELLVPTKRGAYAALVEHLSQFADADG
jgi:hypothetical protein